MKKHQKEYRQFLAQIGPEGFKRYLLTHCNGITDKTKARESILEEDLAKNISLNLHNSFCLKLEQRVQSEVSTKPIEKNAIAKRMDAGL